MNSKTGSPLVFLFYFLFSFSPALKKSPRDATGQRHETMKTHTQHTHTWSNTENNRIRKKARLFFCVNVRVCVPRCTPPFRLWLDCPFNSNGIPLSSRLYIWCSVIKELQRDTANYYLCTGNRSAIEWEGIAELFLFCQTAPSSVHCWAPWCWRDGVFHYHANAIERLSI